MPVMIRIPAVWRGAAGGESRAALPAGTLADVLSAFAATYPLLGPLLLGPNGEVNRGISIFVNQENARYRKDPSEPLKDGDELYIIPMVTGGAGPPVPHRNNG